MAKRIMAILAIGDGIIYSVIAAKVKLSAFRKHPRGPKKPWPKRKSCRNKPHVSTAKILAQKTKNPGPGDVPEGLCPGGRTRLWLSPEGICFIEISLTY